MVAYPRLAHSQTRQGAGRIVLLSFNMVPPRSACIRETCGRRFVPRFQDGLCIRRKMVNGIQYFSERSGPQTKHLKFSSSTALDHQVDPVRGIDSSTCCLPIAGHGLQYSGLFGD